MTGIDTKPAESLALMLESLGHEVFMLTDQAIQKYYKQGYRGGVTSDLLKSMGYYQARIKPTDTLEGFDMFFDLKLQDLEAMLEIHPDIKGALYVINGGCDGYEHYGLHYPTITNNFWIKNAFHVWSPPVDDYTPREEMGKDTPIGLLHNAYGWGFTSYINEIVKKTEVRIYGDYGSPAGKIKNEQVEEKMRDSLCFLHLKSSDCPGWALYEAFETATPVVLPSLLAARMKMEEMYIDGETCLTFGDNIFEQDKDDPRIIREEVDKEMPAAIDELCEKVEKLKDPEYNKKIGMQGHLHWKKLTEWTPEKQEALTNYLNTWSEQ